MDLTPTQNRAIEIPDGVLVVTAGAGTGKTTVLAETVARKMVAANRVDIRELLVLTFTRKAAVEMAERIGHRLRGLADDTSDENEKKWLEENANNVPDAAIETIDAFSQRLLRDYPNEAGVDPGFDVLSPERDRELGYRVATECLEKWRDAPPHEHWLEAVKVININNWPSTLYALHEYIVTRDEPSYALFLIGKNSLSHGEVNELLHKRNLEVEAEITRIREDLVRGFEPLRSLLNEIRGNLNKKGELTNHAKLSREIISDLDALEAWLNNSELNWEDPIVHKVASWHMWGGRFAEDSAPCQARASCKEYKTHLGAKTEVRETLKSLALENYISTFRPAITMAMLAYHDALITARREGNALTFADSEIEALKLLSDHESIRDDCSRKYRYVIVDEYQDINPLQQDLIFKLCRISDKTGLPENLYVVGDERQSIYGFRDADFTLLRDLDKKMQTVEREGAGTRPLYENFRARPELLNLANHVFRYIWGRPGVDADVSHTDLKAEFKPYLEAKEYVTPRIELNLVIADDSRSGRKKEAAVIARRIHDIVRTGELRITDKKSGLERRVRWGDFAVLLRRKAPFTLYEEEFSRLGIPSITESGGGFWDTSEVADVAALLYCLSPAASNLDWAVLLRSPWVGLSDDALCEIAKTSCGGDWNTVFPDLRFSDDRDNRRFAHFSAWFDNIRPVAGHLPVYSLLSKAFVESGYSNRIFALDRGRNTRANIEKLVGKFREEAGIFDPRAAADYLRWLASESATESQASVAPVEEKGAVTLATIHAAKGREWPVVVLADLYASPPKAPGDKEILWDEKYGITFRTFDASTGEAGKALNFLRSVDRAAGKDASERNRVFYVAMTRPREYLILSSYIRIRETKKDGIKWAYGKDSWLGMFEDAMSDNAGSILGSADQLEPRTTVLEFATGEPQPPDSDPAPVPQNLRTFPLRITRNYHTDVDMKSTSDIPETSTVFPSDDVRSKLTSLPVLPEPTAGRYLVTATEVAAFDKCPRMYAYRALWHVPSRAKILAPSGMAASEADDELTFDPDSEKSETFELPSSQWGIIAHGLMEIVPFDADRPHVLSLAENIVSSSGIDPEDNASKLADIVSKTLELDIFNKISRCKIKREFRLLGPLEGTSEVILGTIDLLADCDGTLTVIDYKSGTIDPSNAGVRANSYSLQLALYAHLVAEWKKVSPNDIDAHIVFLDPATDIRVNLDENTLRHAVEIVMRLSDASSRNDFTASPSTEICRWCNYSDICRYSENSTGTGNPVYP